MKRSTVFRSTIRSAADWLVRRAVPAQDLDEVIGDLTEESRANELAGRPLGATLWYVRQAVGISMRYLTKHWRERGRGVRPRASTRQRFQHHFADGIIDLRRASRLLLRTHPGADSRGFTLLIGATLALGIAATATVFSIVNAVVLRPLPYVDPERLVAVLEINQGEGLSHIPASARDYLAWHDNATLFSAMAAYAFSPRAISIAGGHPERLPAAAARAGFFEVFGVSPHLGRAFTESEQEDGAAVVVLSYGLWQRLLGGDPEVVGATLRIDGVAAEIVGVMPSGFEFPDTVQLWVPMGFTPAQLEDRNWHFAHTLARLAPGASLEAANGELAAIAARQSETFPESNGNWTAQAFPLHAQIVGDSAAMLWALLGAVSFVLLIGCVNVTNLLLVRAAGRRREMHLRAALGATRLQQLRQLLAEGVVLSAVSALAGILLAWLGIRILVAIRPVTVPGGGTVELDATVLLFVVTIAAGAAVVFGLAPLATLRTDRLSAGLKGSPNDGARTATGRSRAVLVAAEVSLAVVLVIGSSLMVQSLQGLLVTDPGFPPGGLLTAQIALPAQSYDTPERIRGFWSQLLTRLENRPGIEGAGLASWLPPFSGPLVHHRIEGVHSAWTIDLPAARNRHVSSGYLRVLGVPLIRGRLIDDRDRAGARRVALVDEAFADELFPGDDPIGQSIRVWDDEPREIVGIVGNVKNTGLAGAAQPTSYVPLAQSPWPSQGLVIRTPAKAEDLVSLLRREVVDLDPSLALFSVETMEERLSRSIADPTFQTRFIGLLSVLAVALAAVGIYGLIARSVTERTAEIGIRLALGAGTGSVRRMVIGRALRITVAGLAVGTVAAYAVRGIVADFLFGLEVIDPRLVAVVGATLIGVAAIASWVPARRASRLDPRRALTTD